MSPESTFPLVVPWFSKWTELSESTVREGKRWLSRKGFLEVAGERPSRRGRLTQLWRLGTGERP
jgi:hypothetical protein